MQISFTRQNASSALDFPFWFSVMSFARPSTFMSPSTLPARSGAALISTWSFGSKPIAFALLATSYASWKLSSSSLK